eukprot:jgi/Orpsp1_1/1174665/evm.model.c7180000050902.1
MIYFILIIYIIILIIKTISVIVNNEEDFINSINDKLSNSIIINIDKTQIDISNKIDINNNIEKLSIIGISKDLSIINFTNKISGLVFNDSIQEIKISNVTINGKLELINNKNVIINNVILHGSIDSNSNSNKSELLELNNFIFQASIDSDLKYNCINLYGNVKINNSTFYGNSLCMDSILYYNGENLNSIEIKNSNFNGVYSNNCLNINNAKSVIENSKFEKGANYIGKGGGAIRSIESSISIKNCIFNDNFSLNNGGVFYIYNSYDFNSDKIDVYNSTAIEKGSLIYMYSSTDFQTKANIYNVNQYNTGNIKFPINIGGLIA